MIRYMIQTVPDGRIAPVIINADGNLMVGSIYTSERDATRLTASQEGQLLEYAARNPAIVLTRLD